MPPTARSRPVCRSWSSLRVVWHTQEPHWIVREQRLAPSQRSDSLIGAVTSQFVDVIAELGPSASRGSDGPTPAKVSLLVLFLSGYSGDGLPLQFFESLTLPQ